jgi:flagellar basal body-associated protein FliL
MTAVLLLAALAAGAAAGRYWMHPAAAAGGASVETAPVHRNGLIPLEPFVVNLAGNPASQFLRITVQLVVPEEEALELKEDDVAKMRVRAEILDVLTQQTASVLVTSEGKAELRKVLRERASHALGKAKVVDVLFTDFLVQF